MGDLNATPWGRRLIGASGARRALEAAYPSALGPALAERIARGPAPPRPRARPRVRPCLGHPRPRPRQRPLSRPRAARAAVRRASRAAGPAPAGRSTIRTAGRPKKIPSKRSWRPGATPKGGTMHRIAPLLAILCIAATPATRSRTRDRPTTSAPRPGASTATPSARTSAPPPTGRATGSTTRRRGSAGSSRSRRQRQEPRARLVVQPRVHPRRRGDAAGRGRDHVRHRVVEHRACDRRPDRQAPVGLRPEGAGRDGLQGLLRRRQPRRRALQGQGLRRRLRRPAGGARRGHRQRLGEDTIIDRPAPYTITGAPRVFKGKVIIGNGGAEYGVRGYITAYDAETGEQEWRWFTVPGDPAKPFEDISMAKAYTTWDAAGSSGRRAAAARPGTRWPSTPT